MKPPHHQFAVRSTSIASVASVASVAYSSIGSIISPTMLEMDEIAIMMTIDISA